MLTVEVVEEVEMKNNLGFLSLGNIIRFHHIMIIIVIHLVLTSSAKERHENARRSVQTDIIILLWSLENIINLFES